MYLSHPPHPWGNKFSFLSPLSDLPKWINTMRGNRRLKKESIIEQLFISLISLYYSLSFKIDSRKHNGEKKMRSPKRINQDTQVPHSKFTKCEIWDDSSLLWAPINTDKEKLLLVLMYPTFSCLNLLLSWKAVMSTGYSMKEPDICFTYRFLLQWVLVVYNSNWPVLLCWRKDTG